MIYRPYMLCVPLLGCSFACNTSDTPSASKHPAAHAAPSLASSMPAVAGDVAALARLINASGDVRLQPAGTQAAAASAVGAAYSAGDVLITGPNASATVRFAGNNDVTLAPNSTLLIRPQGGTQASLGAIVMRGSVKAASGGHGARLLIGTPVGMAEIGGTQVSILDVSFDKGLNVEVGEVAVLGANQAPKKKLAQGQSLSIEGFAIPQQTTTIDGLNINHQATTIDGLNINQQTTTIDGLTLAQQTTTVDGLIVPKQTATVAGLNVPKQQVSVDGLDIPGEAAPTPAPAASASKTAPPEPATQPESEPEAAPKAPPSRGLGAFVTVTALPRAAEAQASPKAALRPVVQRMNVFAGGQVRVGKQGHAKVRMGTEAQLNLQPGARFALAHTDADGSDAAYSLDAGQGQLLLTPQRGMRPDHAVSLGQTATHFAPGVRMASADLTSEPNRGRVYLRYGQASVNGAKIEAGQTFSVADGKLVEAPAPIDAPIVVEPGHHVEIYTRGRMLPVAFSAPSPQGGGKLMVELARDPRFTQMLAAEQVSRASFGIDALPAPHVFYRINQDSKTVGSITVIPESDDACPECRHANIVQDTGKKTIVYYQETLPAIDLLWDTVANAVQYHVKVFRDGVFDHAEVDELLTKTKKSLPKGKLPEGHYYWLVTALNKAGREMSEARTNLLQVTYDNVIEKMSIRSPDQGAKVNGDVVDTGGYVVLGQTLSINGQPAEVSKQGRFDESIPLKPGPNTIIYKTVASDGTQRYYSREVVRLKP